MTSVPGTSCRCGVETLDDFIQYRNDEGRLLGGCCTKCHHEWLREEYLHNNDTVVGTQALSRTCIFKKIYKRTPDTFNFCYSLQRINTPASAATEINPGDHIWWELEESGESHAIVEKVNRTKRTLTTIQCKQGNVVRVTVTESRLKRLCKNSLHRAYYNVEERTDLTLARAQTWLEESSLPDVFKGTDSSFAVYCKTGSTSVPGKFTSCICGNNTLGEFRRYILDEDEGLLGSYCKSCGREWLQGKFLPNNECDVYFDIFGTRLIQNKRQKKRVEKGRTRIMTAEYAEDMLKKGDHICWERICWDHHAIVEEVDTENHTITVIHYHGDDEDHTSLSSFKMKESTRVTRQTLHIQDECQNNLYRIDYKQGKEDPQILTIARARSWLNEANYHLIDRNCEAFSVFCKTGVLISWQIVQYGVGFLEWCLSEVCIQTVTVAKFAFAEFIERRFPSKGSGDEIGAIIVLILEVLLLARDVRTLYYSDVTSRDFYYQVFVSAMRRIINVGCVVPISILCQAVGGFLGSLLVPGAGTEVGMYIGGVLGGMTGSILCHAVGTLYGRSIWRIGADICNTVSYILSKGKNVLSSMTLYTLKKLGQISWAM